MSERPLTISITTGTVIKILLLLVGAWLVWELWDLALVLLTAIVLASAIEPAVAALHRRRIPRVLSILLVYILLFGSFFGIFFFFVPTLFGEVALFISSLPEYVDTFNNLGIFNDYAGIFGASEGSTISAPALMENVRSYLSANGMFGNAFSTLANVFGGIFSFILIIVFSFYFTVIRTGVDDFLRVVTPRGYQTYVLDLWDRSQKKIGLWMQGQLLLAVLVGVLVYLGLTILGVEQALLLAVIAAMFEIIPVFGPILAAVPAVLLAMAEGGFALSLLVIALYTIVQQFESHLIHPLVVTRVVGVPPLLVILALIIGAQLAGFLGVLLSVPIAATIQELVKDVKARRFLAFQEQ